MEFHLQEMLRIADEVRVFPLLTLEGKPSPYPDPLSEQLATHGFRVERKRVAYEFQRGWQ